MTTAGSCHRRFDAARVEGQTSRAIVQHHYGSPDVLELSTVPTPAPGPEEVLVRVRTASINARDWRVMRGEPRLARLLDRSSFGLRRPRVAIPGTDLAGTVEVIGADVPRWRVGDHVFGEGAAAFADHAAVPTHQLTALPHGLSFRGSCFITPACRHRDAHRRRCRSGPRQHGSRERGLRWRPHLRHSAGQGEAAARHGGRQRSQRGSCQVPWGRPA